MDYERIKNLLNKYFDGDTTLEEEQYLQAFFTGQKIPPELQYEKYLFDSFNKMGVESEPGSNLHDEMVELIDTQWQKSLKERFQRVIKWSVGVAASLIIGISLYIYQNQDPATNQDTITEQQQAYNATKQVLGYISVKMNAESSKLSSLASFNETLSTIGKLDKIENVIDSIETTQK